MSTQINYCFAGKSCNILVSKHSTTAALRPVVKTGSSNHPPMNGQTGRFLMSDAKL